MERDFVIGLLLTGLCTFKHVAIKGIDLEVP